MRRSRSIIIADDDVAWASVLGLSLRQAGFDVRVAANAEQALELLKAAPSDWLITDAKMGWMSGFELSARAKQLRPSLRVLMVSAVCGKPDAAGFPIEAVLNKPVPFELLLERLQSPMRGGCA